MADQQAAQQESPEFAIQRIYVKDFSFEVPNSPEIFRTEWKPTVDLNLNIDNSSLADDMHEVVVGVTATVKVSEKVAFIVEVKQAGIFTLKKFNADQLQPMLHIACPTILFPYLREAASNVVVKGSFPPLHLEPINFEAIYLQRLKEEEKQKGSQTEDKAKH